ncbi:terminase large subunit [Lacticaseibacillus nasuensis]|uniref:terminase large subunit n=1 Tax=Lacticaseibacillus nasuensis TaxID=944671 RepID=UPI0022469470|nr:terminase TerL endonuclease subunit [Lacticaseibacillus nasuensis]MCX2455632.1 terminase large subunit [Lacticaseibacillus nasuensis]
MKIDLTQSHDVTGAYKSQNYTAIRRKYRDEGTKYAFDVLDGKYITGYLIKLACFRHLQDLRRAEAGEFSFTYDLDKVHAMLKFATICPDVDAMKPLPLMAWQKFVLTQLAGWVTERGEKRYTWADISVGRGQGKTYMMAIYVSYTYLIEPLGKANQDFLVSSINFKQTNKLFGYIKLMLKQICDSEPFKTLAIQSGLALLNDQIIEKVPNNVLREISHEAGQYDSYHFTVAVFDEIGEIKSRDKVSKIISGQVRVPNHQYIQISTAYPDPSVPFHDDNKMMQSTMEKDFDRGGDRRLCLIWAQDSLDETYKPETWEKSNPLLGLDSQYQTLHDGLMNKRESDLMGGTLADFQNKNLNMWLQESTNSFLKLADIERAVIPEFAIDGRQVYLGFDNSLFSDNTALAFVYPYQRADGSQHWHVEEHSFIPWQKAGSIEAKEKQDGIAYRNFPEFCTITDHPQGLINDDQVYQWLMDYVDEHNLEVVFFGYDAWGATAAIKRMELNTAWPLNPIRQRTSELKDPTKFLQKMFVESSIDRLDDKVLEKALVNARIVEDKIGIQVDKASATYKIDVVDAIIDALYQAMYHFEDFADINDRSKQVDRMTEEQIAEWFASSESGLMGGDDDGN